MAQQLGAHEVQADVAVAEPEPGLAAELRDRLERLPRLAGAAPAALLVGEPRQRVEDAVEVGRDPQAQHLEVVRDVADDGDVVRIDDTEQPAQEPRPTDAAREDCDVHAAVSSRSATQHAPCVLAEAVTEPGEIAGRVDVIHQDWASRAAVTSARAAKRSALPGP